jgi:putative restriction endonuclease
VHPALGIIADDARILLTVSEDRRILMSSQTNDVDGVRKILLPDGHAKFPDSGKDQPDPKFLRWHRENCFKGSALS